MTHVLRDDLQPVPDWLMHEVLEPVLADLQRPHPVDFDIGVDPGYDDIVWFIERREMGGAGHRIPDRRTPRARLLVDWADWLQEQVFPETRTAWGEARPECPGHAHPAAPSELDGEAWWVCPADSRRVGRIGQLG